jgi:DsbC/DsbD-like thiol-disulfide interchange protein
MNQRTTGVAVRLVVALTTFMVAAVSAAAAPPPPPQERNQVKATLLADVAAVKPGATFDVGVLLEIAPGWHVYWTNPGDSGLPTQVKFQFPEGFKVGDLRYPTPSRFTTPDGAASFGYSGSVLLTAPVEAPAELKELKELKLAASATWLVCKEVCLPGTAKPELNLPISKNVAPANEALFKKWVEQVPVDVKDSPDVAKLEWTPGGDKAAGEWALVVTWKQAAAPQDVNLFPGPDEALDVRTMDAKTEGNQTRMVVGVRVLAGQKPKAVHLPAVLGYTVKDGVRRGVKTDIAVLTGDGKKAG